MEISAAATLDTEYRPGHPGLLLPLYVQYVPGVRLSAPCRERAIISAGSPGVKCIIKKVSIVTPRITMSIRAILSKWISASYHFKKPSNVFIFTLLSHVTLCILLLFCSLVFMLFVSSLYYPSTLDNAEKYVPETIVNNAKPQQYE